jgi:hypothetical protein
METAGQRSSMSAMQLALEALESDNPDIQLRAAIALRQALETEQEPVAWITDGGKGELWWYQSSKFDEEGNLIGPNPDDIPLYTAPPKRTWVGLTDEEINSVRYSRDWTAHWTDTTFARAIEAKLKERNT